MNPRGRSAVAGVAAAAAAALLASGCERIPDIPDIEIPGLYRVDIRQGNALGDAALARLEVGMPRSKVLHLLGSPAVDDVFHPDRWEYLYSFAPGGEAGEWRHIVLHFEGDTLARIEGDMPPEGTDPTEPEAARVIAVPPRPPDEGIFRRVLDRARNDR